MTNISGDGFEKLNLTQRFERSLGMQENSGSPQVEENTKITSKEIKPAERKLCWNTLEIGRDHCFKKPYGVA